MNKKMLLYMISIFPLFLIISGCVGLVVVGLMTGSIFKATANDKNLLDNIQLIIFAIIFLAGSIASIGAAISFIVKDVRHYKRLFDSSSGIELSCAEEDFSKSSPFFENQIRLGNKYIFKKGSFDVIIINEIENIYLESVNGLHSEAIKLMYTHTNGAKKPLHVFSDKSQTPIKLIFHEFQSELENKKSHTI